jgi:hypothetical protein
LKTTTTIPTRGALSQKDAVAIAVDAYIYGYPLVQFEATRKQFANVTRPEGTHAPMGQFVRMRTYPKVDFKTVGGPNADTLYTVTWLDVSKEPWVLSIPDMSDRYYVMPLHDAWFNNFFIAGSRATGQKAQTYAISGPGWNGSLPSGVTHVESPTGLVFVLGRIYCSGTLEDYARVHALQDRVSAVPLGSYGKAYAPPPGTVDPTLDMTTPPKDVVDAMAVNDFFSDLARLMKTNPPLPQDGPMLAKIAEIGLIPGSDFDPSILASFDRKAIAGVPTLAHDKMNAFMSGQALVNGWQYFIKDVGAFGTNYMLRALLNWLGAGWNVPQDAVYPISVKDANGNAYDGAKHDYVVRFEKGKLPPVKGFWSLTMYDDQYYFVPNDIARHALSQRDEFVVNADGSVDLYLQAESPGAPLAANWLPAPKGPFILFMRLYWPTETPPSILDGSWKPPAVRIKPT